VNVLAIDQGTSATKALLVGPGGEVLGRGEVPVRTRNVGDAGVEADPEELFGSVVAAGAQALAAARAPAHAVALANQGETVLAWDPATGAPLTPAIVWQDRRASLVCERLAGRAAELSAITGATYCLDGQVYTAGSAVRWLAGLGVLGSPSELDAAGSSVPDSGGVIFVPAAGRPPAGTRAPVPVG
jgi:glycerol kinase